MYTSPWVGFELITLVSQRLKTRTMCPYDMNAPTSSWQSIPKSFWQTSLQEIFEEFFQFNYANFVPFLFYPNPMFTILGIVVSGFWKKVCNRSLLFIVPKFMYLFQTTCFRGIEVIELKPTQGHKMKWFVLLTYGVCFHTDYVSMSSSRWKIYI